MSDDNQRILLDIPSSEIHLSLINSLKNNSLSLSKIIINDTKLNLKYNRNKLLFNQKDLIVTSNSETKISFPKVMLNNSLILLTNIENNKSISFKTNSLFASYEGSHIRINSNFIHESSPDPMTLIYEGKNLGSSLNSKIFISGNSVKIPYLMLPEPMRRLQSKKMSFRIWMDMIDGDVTRVSGNISTNQLTVNLGNSEIYLKNVNSDLIYLKENQSETLGLLRMNYLINDKSVNDNKVVINKDENKNLKLFVKKNDKELFKILINNVGFTNLSIAKQLYSSDIQNMNIHISNKGEIEYYSLSVADLSMKISDEYSLKNAKFEIYGTTQKGKLYLKNLSINNNQLSYLDDLTGEVSYILKGKSIYFSTSKLENKQGHEISIIGNKTSKYPSLKIKFSSSLDNIMSSLSDNNFDNYKVSGSVKSNIYFHGGIFFSESKLMDVLIKTSDSIYLSSTDIELYSSSRFVSSNKFNLFINDEKLNAEILTNSNSETYKFVLSSTGFINTKVFDQLIDSGGYFEGEASIKALITYDYAQNKLSSYLTSDLDGVQLNLIKPFGKKTDKKVNFVLKYQHLPAVKYPALITLDQHEFKLRNDNEYFYLNIKSPIARGFIKYPARKESLNRAVGSFEFIDTRHFPSDGVSDSIPAIDIKSKHVKTSEVVLDNAHIILIPQDDFIEIEKLSFKNINLELESSGKWYKGTKDITEISANIKSQNFGNALRALGYPNVLKGGKMEANLNGVWDGSIENFAFSTMNGKLNLKISNGQINELDKGTQTIGQVLGLFSLSSLPKRLSLDFSDFFSKGLRFDSLISDVSFESGMADTEKMIILGSFGEMRLSGKSNLEKRTHNQTLIFIPDLSSTSLVTGAVIGGPIGAAASIFYDKLLKEFGLDTNKLAGIEYSIKGPWENPEIKVTQSFKPILN